MPVPKGSLWEIPSENVLIGHPFNRFPLKTRLSAAQQRALEGGRE